MHLVAVRRALVLSAALSMLAIPAAHAETIAGDGDALTAGLQDTVDLGVALPGVDIPVDLTFRLDCSGTSHVDPGQSIRLSLGARVIPSGGGFGVGSLTFAPGAGWPADGAECPAGLEPVTAGPLRLVLSTPSTPGDDYRFSFTFNRTLLPSSADDASVFTGLTTLSFVVDVSDNTPPQLVMPTTRTAEATAAAGAAVSFSVSATDAEDAQPPTPVCAPASGSTFALGTTTVACTVTDGGGLTDSGSFDVVVADTTAPSLVAMPSDQQRTTGDPAGTAVTFPAPSATDAVDAHPVVGCSPASGSTFAVGTTSVTCTATDASGNHASASFSVDVTYVAPVTWAAVWGEPVATTGAALIANPGRTLPVKVELFANGVEQTRGSASLTVVGCAGGVVVTVPLAWSGGTWAGHLDTGSLAGPGCYTATVSLGGNVAGSFRLDLRGADGTAAVGSSKGPKRG